LTNISLFASCEVAGLERRISPAKGKAIISGKLLFKFAFEKNAAVPQAVIARQTTECLLRDLARTGETKAICRYLPSDMIFGFRKRFANE
jgi:hypothetical protein